MKTAYRSQVQVMSGRDGSAKSSDEKLSVDLAFPKELGGDGNGTNPEQLFVAAYASCFASTLGILAKAEGTPLTQVENSAAVDLLLGDDGLFSLAVRFELKANGQERSTVEALIEKARNTCPYSRAIKDRVPTTITYVA